MEKNKTAKLIIKNIMKKYNIITLCGSTRFKNEFIIDRSNNIWCGQWSSLY